MPTQSVPPNSILPSLPLFFLDLFSEQQQLRKCVDVGQFVVQFFGEVFTSAFVVKLAVGLVNVIGTTAVHVSTNVAAIFSAVEAVEDVSIVVDATIVANVANVANQSKFNQEHIEV